MAFPVCILLENLARRQQLAIYQRTVPRPRLRRRDRLFWTGLRCWREWKSALVIVRPETVVAWHARRFRVHWATRSDRRVGGRPAVSQEVKRFIERMTEANPLWGAPRIHGELLKLGCTVSERTVGRLMPRRRRLPSQTWRTFLANHLADVVAIDFFTVPTATFRVFFVFIVLAHDRRRVRHVNVTEHPTAGWTAQQIVEAFPDDPAPRHLLRDRDAIYGSSFARRVKGLGITEVPTAPHSPWQNAYVERLIGSIRRECLDHVIVFNERHLRRVLKQYLPTTTDRARTWRSQRMPPKADRVSTQTPVGSPRSQRSEGSITVTNDARPNLPTEVLGGQPWSAGEASRRLLTGRVAQCDRATAASRVNPTAWSRTFNGRTQAALNEDGAPMKC